MAAMMMSGGGGGATSSSSSSPCAACKFLRRKCTAAGCVFAPYFPAEQPSRFAHVHRVFGASNVAKLLQELPPSRRDDAVNSLAYEAEARIKDPVYGCVGAISILQRHVAILQQELAMAQAHLQAAINLNPNPPPPPPPPPPPHTSSSSYCYYGGSGAADEQEEAEEEEEVHHHHHHHQHQHQEYRLQQLQQRDTWLPRELLLAERLARAGGGGGGTHVRDATSSGRASSPVLSTMTTMSEDDRHAHVAPNHSHSHSHSHNHSSFIGAHATITNAFSGGGVGGGEGEGRRNDHCYSQYVGDPRRLL